MEVEGRRWRMWRLRGCSLRLNGWWLRECSLRSRGCRWRLRGCSLGLLSGGGGG